MLGSIAGLVASAGVGQLMEAAVAVLPKASSKLTRIGVKIGIASISTVIGKAIKDEVDESIEEAKESFKEARENRLEKVEEGA